MVSYFYVKHAQLYFTTYKNEDIEKLLIILLKDFVIFSSYSRYLKNNYFNYIY